MRSNNIQYVCQLSLFSMSAFQFNCAAFCTSVANRTVDQANIVGETAVSGANEVSQATVEGVENIAASAGMINQVS